MNKKIPRRIIQTGKSLNLDMMEKVSSANVKLINPDFEYLYFTDKDVRDFVGRQFPQYKKMFNSFRFNIQKYDFFRYLAIYHFGGFYFDLDMLLCENLSSLLDHSCVFPFERIGINQYLPKTFNMRWDIGNYAFGAVPGHPFIGAIINNCEKAQGEPDWSQKMLKSIPWIFRKDAYVLCTTGPGLVTRTFAENKDLQSSVTILMPGSIHNRENWNRFGKYGIHVMLSSWRKRRNPFFNLIWRYWRLYIENRNIKISKKATGCIN